MKNKNKENEIGKEREGNIDIENKISKCKKDTEENQIGKKRMNQEKKENET